MTLKIYVNHYISNIVCQYSLVLHYPNFNSPTNNTLSNDKKNDSRASQCSSEFMQLLHKRSIEDIQIFRKPKIHQFKLDIIVVMQLLRDRLKIFRLQKNLKYINSNLINVDAKIKLRRCRGSNPGHPRDRREYSPLYYNDRM